MALDLIKRSELARGLTNAEQDGNLTALETHINGLLAGTTGYEAGKAKDLSGSPVVGLSGIMFPSSQIASSDPNVLDDYEEGTWTPVVKIGGTVATCTATNCTYIKIGNTIVLTGKLAITKGALSGSLTITGLPFTTLTDVFLTHYGIALPAGYTDGILMSIAGDVYVAGSSGLAVMTSAHLGASVVINTNIVGK